MAQPLKSWLMLCIHTVDRQCKVTTLLSPAREKVLEYPLQIDENCFTEYRLLPLHI